MSIAELRQVLSCFYSSETDHEKKRQMEVILGNYKSRPNAHVLALEILQGAQGQTQNQDSELYLVFFAGTILEEVVLRRWASLTLEERWQLRNFLMTFLVTEWNAQPRWVSTKLGKVLVDAGKLSWPKQDPAFVEDIIGLARRQDTRQSGLFLLTLVAEEFQVRGDLLLPSNVKAELQSGLATALPTILNLLSDIIGECRAYIAGCSGRSHDPEVRRMCELLTAALRCLLVVLSSASFAELVSIELLGTLLGVVEAAAGCTEDMSDTLGACGADAVVCLTEVMGKKLIPRHLQPLVIELSRHMLTVLQLLTENNGRRLATINTLLVAQLTEFLSVFLEAHLPRIVAASAPGQDGEVFPMGALLELLAAFTFHQPDVVGFQRCFAPWMAFAHFLTNQEVPAGEAPAAEHAQGLGGVCEKLLDRILFCTNAEMLSDLDDGAENDTGGSRWHMLTLGEEEHEEEIEYGNATLVGEGELELLVAEALELILILAQVPIVGSRLGQNALDLLTNVLQQLGVARVGIIEAERLARDATTLCGVVGTSVAAAAGVDGGWGGDGCLISAATSVATACNQTLTGKIYNYGTAYVRLQGALFDSLARMIPGLAKIVLGGRGLGSKKEKSAAQVLDEAVEAAAAALRDGGVGGAPEAVQLAAGHLLLTLPRHLPAKLLERSTPLVNLLRSAGDVGSRLSPSPRVLLYAAMGTFLLPPRAISGDDLAGQEGLEARAGAYSQLVSPVASVLVTAGGIVQQRQGGDVQGVLDFDSIGVSCRILAALCRSLSSAHSSTKGILYKAISPALGPAVSLVAPCLRYSMTMSAAALSARALLRFLVAAVGSLGKEQSAALATEALEALIAVHGQANADFAAGGGANAFVVCSMYRLLAAVLAIRSKTVAALVPQATALALRSLHSCGGGVGGHDAHAQHTAAVARTRAASASAPEPMNEFLAVASVLLDVQWHCFVTSQRFDKAACLVEETSPLFSDICGVLCQCVAGDVSPTAAASALALLQKANIDHSLYRFDPFTVGWLPRILSSTMGVLIKGSLPLLKEELSVAVRDMAAVNQNAFVQFLPHFMSTIYPHLQQNVAMDLASSWPTPPLDPAAFDAALARFLNDLRYQAALANDSNGSLSPQR